MHVLKISWHIEKHPNNRTKMIVIERCPKCGKPGTLQADKKMANGRRKYRISHSNGRWQACGFGVCDPHWEQLDEIYRSVRRR